MTARRIHPKNFLGNWRNQLWLSIFAAGLSCLGQTSQLPLGATPKQGGTTFRLWVPFVDSVAVKVNDSEPVPMSKESGHTQADDTTWVAEVAGAKVGDHYTYLITANGTTHEFIDPRARQLTTSEVGGASLIVDLSPAPSRSTEPLFRQMVLYELHIGTFNVLPGQSLGTFNSAIERLDFLKKLGVNAVEIMPVHENASSNGHTPVNFNWGYDPVQLFAVNSSYGTPQDLKRFVKACHDRSISVILDVVYNHLVQNNLLMSFGGATGPGFKDGIFFYGDNREDTGFGPRPDYGRPQVRAYVDDNALMWLREYGIDGLRWDSTVNIRAFNDGNASIQEGGQLLRNANDDYRNTDQIGRAHV